MSEIFGYYIPAEKWRLNLKIFAIFRNFMKILIGDFLGRLFSWDEILNNKFLVYAKLDKNSKIW